MTSYSGSCYIGVVGSETEIGECRDTIDAILKRPGDIGPFYVRATKGYDARQSHLTKFIESRCDYLLLLDADMTFPQDALERLRAHKEPYISGYYMRRRFQPIAPVWFKLPPKGVWPMEPWLDLPEHGKLHELGASGWGCLLIHRQVVLDTRKILKGEQDILEDDMDVYPYDLGVILNAIKKLTWLAEEPTPEGMDLRDAMRPFILQLTKEFRVLRGLHDVIGSDIRYPFYARMAGYTLKGDPDVMCGHVLNYPLSPSDFELSPEQIRRDVATEFSKGFAKARADWKRHYREVTK